MFRLGPTPKIRLRFRRSRSWLLLGLREGFWLLTVRILLFDDLHQGALQDMKGRWKHPLSSMSWYRQAKRDFAELRED